MVFFFFRSPEVKALSRSEKSLLLDFMKSQHRQKVTGMKPNVSSWQSTKEINKRCVYPHRVVFLYREP